MANSDFFPFEANFQTSNFTEWTSTVDADAKLTVEHYIPLVQKLGKFSGVFPYRGAYNSHIDLALGTNDAYMQTTVVTAALGATIWIRVFFQITNNLVMATSDRFTIIAVQSGVGTDEATVSILNNAGTIQLVAAETGATAIGAATRQAEFSRDEYHTIDLGITVDSGAADGQILFYLDGNQVGTTITGLTQAAITQLRVGAIGIDAGTTAGHIFFDNVIQSTDSQLGRHQPRFRQVVFLTKSSFIALGPGKMEEYALVSGGAADNHMIVYDLDRQSLPLGDMLGPELANAHPYEAKVFAYSKKDGYFNQGLYVRLTGTAPRATVTLGHAQVGLGLLRQYAMRKL